ncbi:hypothetical protein [Sphingomonas lacusdianchii]|uniref:hypothetical protein n=1 Tax=Sphingomonas lacusdianchii TaxID=2917992 RepID=UPI001F57A511|nr:hypothetical protein [Sphingomonas sp. JXJ CY 53]
MADYDLRLGDDDATKKWGGKVRAGEPLSDFVARLRHDLIELGFRLAAQEKGYGDPTGKFGYWTAMALREFQYYARQSNVAVDPAGTHAVFDYVSAAKHPADRYAIDKPVSGVANAETRRLIGIWKANKWRCPVVICEFSQRPELQAGTFADLKKAKALMVTANLWARFDHKAGQNIALALEFTEVANAPPKVEVIGTAYDPVKNRTGFIGGPTCGPPQSDKDAGITAERLIGKAAPTPSELSSFKVITAVSRYETSNRFDAVNGWDAQILSFGLYQFALTPADDKPAAAELPGFLSMLEAGSADERAAAKRYFGDLGLRAETPWATLKTRPNASLRTYLSMLEFQGPQLASHSSDPAFDETRYRSWGAEKQAREPLRQWHLFRRLVLAGRQSPAVRTALWSYCRLRIRNLLDGPWGPMPAGYQWPADVKLGALFRSETAVAVLLRAHVRTPRLYFVTDAAGKTVARDWLKDAIKAFAYPDKTKPPAQWVLDATLEQALLTTIVDHMADYSRIKNGKEEKFVPADTISQCRKLIARSSPPSPQDLSLARTFALDTTGL